MIQRTNWSFGDALEETEKSEASTLKPNQQPKKNIIENTDYNFFNQSETTSQQPESIVSQLEPIKNQEETDQNFSLTGQDFSSPKTHTQIEPEILKKPVITSEKSIAETTQPENIFVISEEETKQMDNPEPDAKSDLKKKVDSTVIMDNVIQNFATKGFNIDIKQNNIDLKKFDNSILKKIAQQNLKKKMMGYVKYVVIFLLVVQALFFSLYFFPKIRDKLVFPKFNFSFFKKNSNMTASITNPVDLSNNQNPNPAQVVSTNSGNHKIEMIEQNKFTEIGINEFYSTYKNDFNYINSIPISGDIKNKFLIKINLLVYDLSKKNISYLNFRKKYNLINSEFLKIIEINKIIISTGSNNTGTNNNLTGFNLIFSEDKQGTGIQKVLTGTVMTGIQKVLTGTTQGTGIQNILTGTVMTGNQTIFTGTVITGTQEVLTGKINNQLNEIQSFLTGLEKLQLTGTQKVLTGTVNNNNNNGTGMQINISTGSSNNTNITGNVIFSGNLTGTNYNINTGTNNSGTNIPYNSLDPLYKINN